MSHYWLIKIEWEPVIDGALYSNSAYGLENNKQTLTTDLNAKTFNADGTDETYYPKLINDVGQLNCVADDVKDVGFFDYYNSDFTLRNNGMYDYLDQRFKRNGSRVRIWIVDSGVTDQAYADFNGIITGFSNNTSGPIEVYCDSKTQDVLNTPYPIMVGDVYNPLKVYNARTFSSKVQFFNTLGSVRNFQTYISFAYNPIPEKDKTPNNLEIVCRSDFDTTQLANKTLVIVSGKGKGFSAKVNSSTAVFQSTNGTEYHCIISLDYPIGWELYKPYDPFNAEFEQPSIIEIGVATDGNYEVTFDSSAIAGGVGEINQYSDPAIIPLMTQFTANSRLLNTRTFSLPKENGEYLNSYTINDYVNYEFSEFNADIGINLDIAPGTDITSEMQVRDFLDTGVQLATITSSMAAPAYCSFTIKCTAGDIKKRVFGDVYLNLSVMVENWGPNINYNPNSDPNAIISAETRETFEDGVLTRIREIEKNEYVYEDNDPVYILDIAEFVKKTWYLNDEPYYGQADSNDDLWYFRNRYKGSPLRVNLTDLFNESDGQNPIEFYVRFQLDLEPLVGTPRPESKIYLTSMCLECTNPDNDNAAGVGEGYDDGTGAKYPINALGVSRVLLQKYGGITDEYIEAADFPLNESHILGDTTAGVTFNNQKQVYDELPKFAKATGKTIYVNREGKIKSVDIDHEPGELETLPVFSIATNISKSTVTSVDSPIEYTYNILELKYDENNTYTIGSTDQSTWDPSYFAQDGNTIILDPTVFEPIWDILHESYEVSGRKNKLVIDISEIKIGTLSKIAETSPADTVPSGPTYLTVIINEVYEIFERYALFFGFKHRKVSFIMEYMEMITSQFNSENAVDLQKWISVVEPRLFGPDPYPIRVKSIRADRKGNRCEIIGYGKSIRKNDMIIDEEFAMGDAIDENNPNPFGDIDELGFA